MSTRRSFASLVLGLLVSSVGLGARAADGVGTLTLDGLSFLSFEGAETLPIPSGSTIRFKFASAAAAGSIAFTIAPGDVSIAPIPLGSDRGTLQYRLAAPASGTLSRTDGGLRVAFNAGISVTRSDGETSAAKVYSLQFTTEHASATGSKTGVTTALDGMRVVEAARYVQLVGAVANDSRAVPHPGRAVYTVLSGTFDWLPEVR